MMENVTRTDGGEYAGNAIRTVEITQNGIPVPIFVLETQNTSYVFRADEAGNLVHLYYGEKIGLTNACREQVIVMADAASQKCVNQNGCSIIQDSVLKNQCLDDVCLEVSFRGKGDMREPFLELVYEDLSMTSDFRYEGFRLSALKENPDNMPGAYFENENTVSNADNNSSDNNASDNNASDNSAIDNGVSDNTGENASSDNNDVNVTFGKDMVNLVIIMKDRNSSLTLELNYTVFADCDCITRFARLIRNKSKNDTDVANDNVIKVKRLMSAQLDLEADELKITSFHGDWAREMGRFDTLLQAGKFINDSSSGFSSNKANPFVMFGERALTEQSGECYAMNLIYSGNHRESMDLGGHCKARALTGINPDFLEWELEDTLCSPEAVLTFTNKGYQGISANMHRFVREHIVRGSWKHKERPVLLNSWEAAYFDISEKKLLRLAKAAADIGIELFVMDDGWFGKRNDDTSSLGDWYDNTEKLPQGIAGLGAKIRKLGMMFGIWVEPEMISENSELYKKHPEWAVRIPGKPHSLGRNQMLLDLTNKAVRSYIIESMTDVFKRSGASYVKWDMNRHMSDYFGSELKNQGEFAHRYITGLYEILGELTRRFPDILFEGCASGGNRFDLGMLCYMPQIWASDNTDAVSRASIQNGYSYGYPQSVIGAHVSGCPNHQTLRNTPLATRFAVSAAGLLGYELNLCDLRTDELSEIKEEILLYKKWRSVLQFGSFYRLKDNVSFGGERRSFDSGLVGWQIVSEDKKMSVAIMLNGLCIPNYSHRSLKAVGLDDKTVYRFYNRTLKYDIHRMGDLINTMAPVHVKPDSMLHGVISKFVKLDGETEDYKILGSILNKNGVQLAQGYAGTGFGTNTAIYQDFDARMYFMECADD